LAEGAGRDYSHQQASSAEGECVGNIAKVKLADATNQEVTQRKIDGTPKNIYDWRG
jgi:hypothetical protein